MATAVICRSEPKRTPHTDAPSPFSSLAVKQSRTNRRAAWILDADAPFPEQPPPKRIQVVLCSIHKIEVHFTQQTKPVNDIVAVIETLALRNGYATIPQITSVPYGQSHGGHASHSGQRKSGGAGQNAPESTVPSGAGNGGNGPSKHPMKRGGNGDGEGNPNKKKKLSNELQRTGAYCCIIFELNQQSPKRDKNHPCRDRRFVTLEGAIVHHLRIHVGHIQCETCFIRKGTMTDMNKHKLAASCISPSAGIREIKIHGENIRRVKSWEELVQQVAPNGEIQYDMASNIDKLTQLPVGDDNSHAEQAAAPLQHQISPVGTPALADNTASDNILEMFHNNPFGYSLHTPGGISYNLSTLANAIDPKCLSKSNFDSGYSDLEGPSSQQGTKICRCQYSKVQGEAGTGAGAGQAIGGNEAPEQDASSRLLERVNWVIEAFLECDNYPIGRQIAHLCAQNIAIQVPENILRVFAEAYQSKVGLKRETQAYSPTRGTKGKEEEQ